MTAYSDFKKSESVLAHCQGSANTELYKNAAYYGKAAGFFDTRNHLTPTGSDLEHILLVYELRNNSIAAQINQTLTSLFAWQIPVRHCAKSERCSIANEKANIFIIQISA